MIAQKSTLYSIKETPDGFRVFGKKDQHSHGCYPTRQAAETHILTLTATRAQTHRAARDLAQLAATATLALALLVAPLGASAAPSTKTVCIKKQVAAIVYRNGKATPVMLTVWKCHQDTGGDR